MPARTATISFTSCLLALLVMASPLLAAEKEAAWTPVFADEQWYKDQAGAEQVVAGTLEAVPEAGPGTLMRPAQYRLGNRTLYTAGKKHAALDALVGQKVEIRGKVVDMELEGQAVHELWPGAVRA